MIIFLFVGLAVLISIADRAPIHLETRFPNTQVDQEFYDYLNGVLEGTLPGPFVYRILVPYTYSALSHFDNTMNILNADFFLKIFEAGRIRRFFILGQRRSPEAFRRKISHHWAA